MNITIQITPHGSFVATPSSLGLTLQESIAVERGQLPMDRFEAMLANVKYAMAMLAEAQPMGKC